MLDAKKTEKITKDMEQGEAIIKQHNRLDLTCGEINFLVTDVLIKDDALFYAVCRAFEIGAARGYRIGRREARTCSHRR